MKRVPMVSVIILVMAMTLAGCAAMNRSLPMEIQDAMMVIDRVGASDAAQNCPDEYKAIKQMYDDALAIYRACNSKAAIAKATAAKEKAEKLCKPAMAEKAPVAAAVEKPAAMPVKEPEKAAKTEKPAAPAAPQAKPSEDWTLQLVRFDFDKYDIKPKYKAMLNDVTAKLGAAPFSDSQLILDGHTCNIGTEEYNLALSEKRANAVKAYLVLMGVNPERIKVVGYGELLPAYPNKNEEGRSLNRRVQIRLGD